MRVPLAILTVALLAFTLPGWSGPSGAESGDDMASAWRIQPGTEIFGRLNETTVPANWTVISVAMGRILNVTVFSEDWPALDAGLEIYDRQGSRQGYSLSPYRWETVVILATYTGDYYIRVFAGPGGGGGGYSFIARIQDPIPAVSGGVYKGELYNDTDHPADIFRIFLEAGDIVGARLNETPIPGAGGVFLDLYLMDLWPSGGFYTYLDVSWWGDPVETVTGKAAHDGYYYIVVTAFNGSGRYELSVNVESGAPERYVFPPDVRNVFSRSVFNGTLDQSMRHYSWYRLNVSFATGQRLDVGVQLGSGWETGIFELFILDERLGVLGSATNYLVVFNETSNRSEGRTAGSMALDRTFTSEGTYYIMLMAKWSVREGRADDLTDADTSAAYSITFDIPRENHAPVAAHPPAALGTDEDLPLAGLFLDQVFDDADIADGDLLHFSVSGSEHLSVRLAPDSEVAITPAPDWSGREQVVFWATDSLGASAGLRANVTVNPVNDPPAVLREVGDIALEEGRHYPDFLDLRTVFGDPDIPYGDALVYSLTESPLPLNITPLGFLSSGPVPGVPGHYRILLRARDLSGLDAVVYINITVARLPHSPVPLTPTLALNLTEGTEYAGPFVSELFLDPDGEPLSLNFRSLGNVLASVGADGRLHLVPAAGWSGVEEIFVEAWDAENLSANLTVVANVRQVNQPPRFLSVIPDGDLSVEEGGGTVLRIVATDRETPQNLSFEWSVDGSPVMSTLSKGTAFALRSLGPGYHHVSVTVRDPGGESASRTWAVAVTPRPPSAGTTITVAQASGSAVVAVGLGAWLLAFLGLTENGKYALFKFLVIPLYTKIRREEVLDHFTRGRIYGMIESSPGVHYTLIKKKVGVGNGTLTYHLSTLEREGFIRSEWDGLYKRFYPSQMATAPGEPVVELSAVQKELLGHIGETPGISQKELVERTGVSKRVVSYHIAQMAQARLVRVERDGKKVRCYKVDQAS
jgi:predicted transcriptional regulator